MKDYKIKQGYKVYKVKCSVCSDRHYPDKMNGIWRETGMRYYCHKKECQEIFDEDACQDEDYY